MSCFGGETEFDIPKARAGSIIKLIYLAPRDTSSASSKIDPVEIAFARADSWIAVGCSG